MLECKCEEYYKQDNPTEPIKVGDIISLDPNTNKVKRAFNKDKKQDQQIIRYLL